MWFLQKRNMLLVPVLSQTLSLVRYAVVSTHIKDSWPTAASSPRHDIVDRCGLQLVCNWFHRERHRGYLSGRTASTCEVGGFERWCGVVCCLPFDVMVDVCGSFKVRKTCLADVKKMLRLIVVGSFDFSAKERNTCWLATR
jgi:hypothetical protein